MNLFKENHQGLHDVDEIPFYEHDVVDHFSQDSFNDIFNKTSSRTYG